MGMIRDLLPQPWERGFHLPSGLAPFFFGGLLIATLTTLARLAGLSLTHQPLILDTSFAFVLFGILAAYTGLSLLAWVILGLLDITR